MNEKNITKNNINHINKVTLYVKNVINSIQNQPSLKNIDNIVIYNRQT
jgi:hypothetical protein